MQVQLKQPIFTATQWFKDGDHPAVIFYPKPPYTEDWYKLESEHGNLGYEDEGHYYKVVPGDWIVEMFDGLHLFGDDEFRELFDEVEQYSDGEYLALQGCILQSTLLKCRAGDCVHDTLKKRGEQ